MLVAIECSRRLGLCLQHVRPTIQFTSVRWNRKPKWLGTAKSKIFKIPVKPPQPMYEEEEMKRLTDNHRTYIRSLWLYQRAEHERLEAASQDHARESTEEAEIGKLMEDIERDNAKVRSIREAALVEELKIKENEILARKEKLELYLLEKQEATEKDVQFQMERLKHAIRPDNLDEAIEKAISNPTDPNFGIDKTGNRYYGRVNSTVATPASEL